MIATLLLLAQQAAPLPTVGDTVWITRNLPVATGMTVRPRPIGTSAVAEPIGPPEVTRLEGTVRIRYPLVAWQPGSHSIVVPGVILVRADGWSDTLPDGRATIEVGSVLPASGRDTLSPLPPAGPVPRSRRSPLPAVLLGGLALALLAPVHWWWGRRNPPVSFPKPPLVAGPVDAMLASWLMAGEYRAAIEGWHYRFSLLAAQGRLDRDGESLREQLSEARFAPLEPVAAGQLCRAAAGWVEGQAA